MRIALLEDDLDLADLISLWLEADGSEVVAYNNGGDFRKAFAREKFDVLVLDWFLPDTTGLDELDWVRGELGSDVPTIFLTSRRDEESIIEALNHGADDYMLKPVNRGIAIARINALHRRNRQTSIDNQTEHESAQNEGVEYYEPFQIDHIQRDIFVDGEAVKLTNKEYEVATYMFRNESTLISRDDLMKHVWGTKAELNTRTVDTHISRIRSKLGINLDTGWQLNSIYQCGYRLFRLH